MSKKEELDGGRIQFAHPVILDVVQGSDEWLEARAGKLSASRFADLMAKLRSGKPGASRTNLIAEQVVERVTGRKTESFQNAAMLRGIELEPHARAAYEDHHMVSVEEVGMMVHHELSFVSCSPDGLVGDDGLVEIKCPNAANHLDYGINGTHATQYRWQIQGQLWISNRQWCDIVSFHPDFPEQNQLAIVRVERDDDAIRELHDECLAADEEIRALILGMNEYWRI